MFQETMFRKRSPTGKYRDVLLNSQGQILWEKAWCPNLIVNGLSNLLAALVKGDPQGQRLMFWAIGRGVATWDEGVRPANEERLTRNTLYNEVGRKEIPPAQMTFLDDSLNPQTGASHLLQITLSFSTTEDGIPAGSLREFGLFSGGDATHPSILINHVIHPQIDLQENFMLQRTLRLNF